MRSQLGWLYLSLSKGAENGDVGYPNPNIPYGFRLTGTGTGETSQAEWVLQDQSTTVGEKGSQVLGTCRFINQAVPVYGERLEGIRRLTPRQGNSSSEPVLPLPGDLERKSPGVPK